MRHLRISGQNIKNLSTFKSQIGVIFQQLNKFEEDDKKEALNYIKNWVNKDPMSRRRRRRRKRELASHPKLSVCPRKIRHTCKVCETTCKFKREMFRHVQTHVGAPRSCIKCRQTFNGGVPFTWHLGRYCKPVRCEWRFKCDQCPREFVSRRNLESHEQGHRRNNCTYCDKVLTKRAQLVKHLLEVHSVKLERDTHKCQHCEKRYIKKGSLYYHLRQHLPDKFVCLECGEISETIDESDAHRRQHDLQKHFTCKLCNEKFSRRQQYLFHLRRHNQYKCLTCNESYASREKVSRHKQQGHQVEGLSPRFLCPHCPLAFHRESRLHGHIRRHSEDLARNINCKYCKKTFNSPYAYYKHCLTISHERFSPEVSNTSCEKCGKRFSKKGELRQHLRRVHDEAKPTTKCQYCGYKTAHKNNMERHVALHFRNSQEYACEHCGKVCASISSLKDHIAYNHKQGRHFRCTKCGKWFKRNSELVRHQDTHSDERPHTCAICGKAYKRANHLRRHEASAHELVKKSRRVKQVKDETHDALQTPGSSKILFTHNVDSRYDNILLNFDNNEGGGGNIVEQLSSYLPERGWEIDSEDLYNVYNEFEPESEILLDGKNLE